MKHCNKCSTDKLKDEFHVRNSTHDKLHPHCKVCVLKWSAEFRGKNREHIREYKKSPKAVATREAYQKTDACKAVKNKSRLAGNEKYPDQDYL